MDSNRVSSHYMGSAGEAYFQYQSAFNAARGSLETWKFRDYIRPTDTIVDFGCGSGLMLKALPGLTKLGIEVNPAARKEAALQGIMTVPSVVEIEDQFADVAVSNHALEHTIRPLDELEQLRRILKPGGRLVICLPFDDWRMHRRFVPNLDEPNHHLYTWSPLLLRNLLVEAGYDVSETKMIRFTWPPLTLLLSRILPHWLFLMAGSTAAFARQSRQVFAVAQPR